MKNLFDAESLRTATTGMVGIGATGGGFYVSILPKVEAWLRIISLLIGIAVGVASLISIIRTKRKNKKPTFRKFLDLIE
jgi:hypothetical protein